jgi:DNA polymerase III epsilon subunit-like protein
VPEPRRKTIFFDVETGGTQPQHPTIQLAAVAIDDESWKELDSFQVKIQFDPATCDPEALKMNHYDPEVWAATAKSRSAIAGLFSRWSQPYLCVQMESKRKPGVKFWVASLAGHNAQTFDLPRLQELFAGTFFPFSYHVRDTLQRAMWFYHEHPELTRPESLKLSVLAQAFGIDATGAHDALTDVRLSVQIARFFADFERKKGS